MKKILKTLALVVLCAFTLSATAFASEQILPDENGMFNIVYEDGTDGDYYSLVVVEGIYEEGDFPTISYDTVLHVSSAVGTESGVSFDGFVPASDEPATVYVGGTSLGAPMILGYINNAELYKVCIYVTTEASKDATVLLTADGKEYEALYDEEDDAYVAYVLEGSYTLEVTASKHVPYTKKDYVVEADMENWVTLKYGDVTLNDTIDYYDLVEIVNSYGDENDDYDLTGDGIVDDKDIIVALDNYKAKSTIK